MATECFARIAVKTIGPAILTGSSMTNQRRNTTAGIVVESSQWASQFRLLGRLPIFAIE